MGFWGYRPLERGGEVRGEFGWRGNDLGRADFTVLYNNREREDWEEYAKKSYQRQAKSQKCLGDIQKNERGAEERGGNVKKWGTATSSRGTSRIGQKGSEGRGPGGGGTTSGRLWRRGKDMEETGFQRSGQMSKEQRGEARLKKGLKKKPRATKSWVNSSTTSLEMFGNFTLKRGTNKGKGGGQNNREK